MKKTNDYILNSKCEYYRILEFRGQYFMDLWWGVDTGFILEDDYETIEELREDASDHGYIEINGEAMDHTVYIDMCYFDEENKRENKLN